MYYDSFDFLCVPCTSLIPIAFVWVLLFPLLLVSALVSLNFLWLLMVPSIAFVFLPCTLHCRKSTQSYFIKWLALIRNKSKESEDIKWITLDRRITTESQCIAWHQRNSCLRAAVGVFIRFSCIFAGLRVAGAEVLMNRYTEGHLVGGRLFEASMGWGFAGLMCWL